MTKPVYKEMLEVMKNRGGPYAGADIPEFFAMVEELYLPEEAEVNNVLTRKPAAAESVAAILHRDQHEITPLLEKMADKGLCAVYTLSGSRVYQGIPFMPGIFEYKFFSGTETERDKKIARLIYAYKKAYQSVKGIDKITYPVTRVIPVDRKIKADNVIHTYDQVKTYIEKYDTIGVGMCYCRQTAKLRGEDIHDMPIDVCMWFGRIAENIIERLGGRRISKTEAGAILDRCEEAGLVHMSRNTTEDIDFLCNCDRWHCEVVTNVLKQPKPGLIFNSGFQPIFDAKSCIRCGTCVERCPAEAVQQVDDDVPAINTDLCFGCGICATGCSENAITMGTKPDFPIPPKDVKELAARRKASG